MSRHDNDTNERTESRRRFLKMAAGTAAMAAVAGTGTFSRLAHASGLTPLSPSDPMAKALHYTNDASTTKNPKHKKGNDCSNCMFYKGKPGAKRGPCQLFPGHTVSSKGWCVSHQVKTS